MFRLFESIKVVNGQLLNLEYHNERVNRSRRQLFNAHDNWDLADFITIPEIIPGQVYKCRFTYDEIPGNAEFSPYSIKPLKTLTIADGGNLHYNHKLTNREGLELLKQNNPQYDDVIIVINGKVTDISYANLVFWDGAKWITPASPLLNGTKRQQYLHACRIFEREIKICDISGFEKIAIINAMIDLEESPVIFTKDINILSD